MFNWNMSIRKWGFKNLTGTETCSNWLSWKYSSQKSLWKLWKLTSSSKWKVQNMQVKMKIENIKAAGLETWHNLYKFEEKKAYRCFLQCKVECVWIEGLMQFHYLPFLFLYERKIDLALGFFLKRAFLREPLYFLKVPVEDT